MIIQADARHIPLADGSVQCVVTSPPYWGLRDYQVQGQIGLEPTPEAYVATMVQVFREVKKVLRDDGTLWLNLGDSYSGSGKGGQSEEKRSTNWQPIYIERRQPTNGMKPKDLIGIPWRVAFALQADGWYLRSDIIWAKNNPMPESVTDRPTRSHEYLFLLSKSERYFYDSDAIREAAEYGRREWKDEHYKNGDIRIHHKGTTTGGDPSAGRNRRDVWTVNSEPTPEAHFATFPQKLIEPCILAGTSAKGCCAECGAPRVRMTESTRLRNDVSVMSGKAEARANGIGYYRPNSRETGGVAGLVQRETTGWQPSCAHDAPTVPCMVFDPFGGTSTVGLVAERYGRKWVTLELSADYVQIARRRTRQLGLFNSVLAERS